MKQTDKLDLVLRALYEQSGRSGEIVKLLKSKDVEVSLDDAHTLGRRLADAGYVKFNPTRDSAWVDMKSEGIEFVEGSSFAHPGQAVINNHYNTISGSPNANIVSQSNHTTINQSNITEAKRLINQIKDEVSNDTNVNQVQRQEIAECLDEVEASVNAGKIPKHSLLALAGVSSDIASVTSLVIQLGQLMGLV